MTVVYDAGALVAADRSDRAMWAMHRRLLQRKVKPVTTAAVVAQVSRTGRQMQLRRFLEPCTIVPLSADEAHEIGALARRSGVANVVDVHVVAVAARRRVGVVTSDVDDLRPIVAALATPIPLFPI